MKSFQLFFLKNCKGNKVETWYRHGQWVNVLCIPELGPRAHNFWSCIQNIDDRFYNLPSMKTFCIDFSGTMRAIKLKLGTHMDSGLMYHMYQNQGHGPLTL